MSRRALALAALLTLLTPAAAVAQTAGVTRSRLPNGLTVIVRENPAAPVVAYSLLVKMGTRTETPDTAGISNMLQLMLVRGTEKMNGEQIAAAADRMGGSIDAYGDADYSEIAATALSRNWLPMLELVSDVALRPTVPDGTVRARARLHRAADQEPRREALRRRRRPDARRALRRRPSLRLGLRSAAGRAWSGSRGTRSWPTTGASTCPIRWCSP